MTLIFAYLEKRLAKRYYLSEVNVVFYLQRYSLMCQTDWFLYGETIGSISSIFVADTKIISGYNFVAPLTRLSIQLSVKVLVTNKCTPCNKLLMLNSLINFIKYFNIILHC